jgi:16S rRNA (adenine1518-N6/adenine1519-N6)-dimethyltransferase
MDFEVRRCLIVAPGAFSPPPRVQSALISLKRRTCPLFPMSNPDHFRRFLRAAFAQRRKTLLNNLKSFSAPLSLVKDTLKELSLKDKARAEQLSIAQLVALFERLTAGPPNQPPH